MQPKVCICISIYAYLAQPRTPLIIEPAYCAVAGLAVNKKKDIRRNHRRVRYWFLSRQDCNILRYRDLRTKDTFDKIHFGQPMLMTSINRLFYSLFQCLDKYFTHPWTQYVYKYVYPVEPRPVWNQLALHIATLLLICRQHYLLEQMDCRLPSNVIEYFEYLHA